ncbi:NERD domain-containing protein [Caldibacillus lycopersici]|uniref:NERD domain-containing protein n=1 Tax=Perspicuibacillus lycopersici TaxID=1325689 RepID=A0AAE3LSX3_9BACI|nr:nuclease-related domain-containing protein [Perspicuibacillus lycopersici]MCU9613228.1 NERD domain-containing protein [Perspicuibacillus lycopersici]
MNVKPYELPADVCKYGALNGRLIRSHKLKAAISAEFKKMMAGQHGEKELYYHLQYLPYDKFFILHDVRLVEHGRVFQMDVIVFTSGRVFILEVKNFKGFIFFNEISQLVHQREDGSEEVYNNPVTQVEKQKLQLQSWLAQNGLPAIPIETFVVIGNSTKFHPTKNQFSKYLHKIIPISNIHSVIVETCNKSNRPILNGNGIQQLSTTFLSSHIPLERDLLSKYNISKNDLLTGVQCPNCAALPMKRVHGKWVCLHCQHEGKMDFVHALNDYYLLIDESISVRQAMEFLHVPSDHVVTYMMQKAKYKRVGRTAGSRYVLRYVK